MTKLIFLADISPGSPTVRDSIREDVVEQYSERYRNKQQMPPVVVFSDGKAHYLADGSHRCAAIAQVGRKDIEAEVHKGTYEDALQYALHANSAHGLPRSSADKRKAVAVAIKQWPKEANGVIAKRCDVDDHTVKDVRVELETAKIVAPEPVRTDSRGRKVAAERVAKVDGRKSDLEPPKEEIKVKSVTDKNGTPIPKAVVKYWERADEAMVLIAAITEVMNSLKQADREKDLLFAEVNISAAIGDLEKVRMTIGCAIPFAVCTQCAGHPEIQPKGECRLCLGRGLISKFRWERLVPEEVRKMVMKGVVK